VSVLLRFVGVMNMAVWLGAALFFFFGVTPATYSPDMKLLLTERSHVMYAGIIDHIYWERLFMFEIWCGAIALAHQCAEWLYLGRRLRLTFWLVAGLLGLTLIDGIVLQPHIERLQAVKFAYQKTAAGYQGQPAFTAQQREKAARSLEFWRKMGRIGAFGLDSEKISTTMNWLALSCLTVLAWRVVNTSESFRFVPASKFRS
jgi:hypothetical protein